MKIAVFGAIGKMNGCITQPDLAALTSELGGGKEVRLYNKIEPLK